MIQIQCSDTGTISSEWLAFEDLPQETAMLSQLIYQAVCSESSASEDPSITPDPVTGAKPPNRVVSFFKSLFTRNPLASPKASAADATLCEGSNEDDMFSFINEALEAKDWDRVKSSLDDFTLVINTDIGGRAEFLDLQASLVQGPSFNLLFSRLVDELDDQFDEYYTNEEGKSTEKESSVITVEEVLFQALSSIASFTDCFSEEALPEASAQEEKSQSKVMFVGTYRDKAKKDEEFKRKDQLLQEKIRNTEFFDKGIVEFAAEDQLMLSVNNMYGEKEEIEEIRRVFEKIIRKNFKKVKIPAAWLLLSLKIRRTRVRTMSLRECEELAGKLKIPPDELQHALWFLHHRIGTLLYYPEVEALKDTVICQMQVVFDSVTDLIKNTFAFDDVGKAVSERFREKAQFSVQDVKTAVSGHTILPPEKLVKLLEYLNILTPIPSTPSSEGKSTVQPTYFMPCVLKSARASELSLPSSSKRDPAPLMLRYDCGYVPIGMFPSLITNLVSSQQANGWKMIEEGLRKNKVQFQLGEDFDKVTLVSRPRFFEIAVTRQLEESTASTESLCSHVRSVIQSTLSTVTSRFDYNFSMGYKFGFECPLHPGKEHLCVLADETADAMLCLQSKKPVAVQPQQKMWFPGKPSSPAPNSSTGSVFYMT